MDRHDWDRRYAGSELVWSAGPNRFVAEHTEDLRPGRAVDVAAGEGRNAAWLATRGWRVLAVDFSTAAVAKGRDASRARGLDVDWLVADLTTWSPPAGAFDLVLVCYLQLPVPDRSVAYRAAARAVAPGGTLLVVAHDRRNLTDGHGGPQDAGVLATATDVVALLGDLTVEQAGEVTREVVRDDGTTAVAIDHLVRARRDR